MCHSHPYTHEYLAINIRTFFQLGLFCFVFCFFCFCYQIKLSVICYHVVNFFFFCLRCSFLRAVNCGTILEVLFLIKPRKNQTTNLSPTVVSLVVVSLFVLLVSFPIQILYFFSDSFGVNQFYHWLLLLLHRLTRYIRWYRPLRYVAILYLLFVL